MVLRQSYKIARVQKGTQALKDEVKSAKVGSSLFARRFVL